ncbi:MAG: hypothetical protein NTX56_18770 [Proteobacteria bacterium]|nr:hypothetical protein [Pseudomonadota bacterium]
MKGKKKPATSPYDSYPHDRLTLPVGGKLGAIKLTPSVTPENNFSIFSMPPKKAATSVDDIPADKQRSTRVNSIVPATQPTQLGKDTIPAVAVSKPSKPAPAAAKIQATENIPEPVQEHAAAAASKSPKRAPAKATTNARSKKVQEKKGEVNTEIKSSGKTEITRGSYFDTIYMKPHVVMGTAKAYVEADAFRMYPSTSNEDVARRATHCRLYDVPSGAWPSQKRGNIFNVC